VFMHWVQIEEELHLEHPLRRSTQGTHRSVEGSMVTVSFIQVVQFDDEEHVAQSVSIVEQGAHNEEEFIA
jgi:hypothetical protein